MSAEVMFEGGPVGGRVYHVKHWFPYMTYLVPVIGPDGWRDAVYVAADDYRAVYSHDKRYVDGD